MTTLTATLRADLQGDLGIGSDEAVFTNDELDRNYTRAEGDYNKTVVYCFRQLLSSAIKFTRYTAGSSSEARNQIFDHLRVVLKDWENRAGMAGGALKAGVISLGIDQADTDSEWS